MRVSAPLGAGLRARILDSRFRGNDGRKGSKTARWGNPENPLILRILILTNPRDQPLPTAHCPPPTSHCPLTTAH